MIPICLSAATLLLADSLVGCLRLYSPLWLISRRIFHWIWGSRTRRSLDCLKILASLLRSIGNNHSATSSERAMEPSPCTGCWFLMTSRSIRKCSAASSWMPRWHTEGAQHLTPWSKSAAAPLKMTYSFQGDAAKAQRHSYNHLIVELLIVVIYLQKNV